MNEPSSLVAGLDHISLAMPAGGEDAARAFFGDAIGLREIAKPALLATRNGVWFAAGAVDLHIAVEENFRPAGKAHPAFAVVGLQALRQRLMAHGIAIVDDESWLGRMRFYAFDPFGNRLEFIAAPSAPA